MSLNIKFVEFFTRKLDGMELIDFISNHPDLMQKYVADIETELADVPDPALSDASVYDRIWDRLCEQLNFDVKTI